MPRIETYKRVEQGELKAHIFATDAPNGKLRAAIVLFHGGGWNSGQPEWVYSSARRFAERGMVAIAIQYRLADEKAVTPLDAMADARDAIRWVRDNAGKLGVDVKRVAAYGVSAGGHLASAAATIDGKDDGKSLVSAKPDALVLYSPAVAIANSGWARKLLLGRAKPEEVSPDQLVRAGLPPTHITQGDEDVVTPFSGARNFCRRMTDAGNICGVRRYSGLGHLLTRKLDEQEFNFDPDTVARADAWRAEEKFLVERGFIDDAASKAAVGFDGPETVVRAQLAAFNAHDVDAMVRLVADDLVWYNIKGDEMSVEAKGSDALRKGMEGYFKSLPSAKSEIHTMVTNGNFVSVRERVTWKSKTGEDRSQNALAVYEVIEGKIKRVWYYPVQK
ncbi:MAG: alpha/beta hydrolase fold domain-containing protein [Betaproteobacteria bacterium]|nr:alpha/beta hydrolase fold domain-containing protein [Betaproteobacteria bacterium]